MKFKVEVFAKPKKSKTAIKIGEFSDVYAFNLFGLFIH
jgi:hypothetical protein